MISNAFNQMAAMLADPNARQQLLSVYKPCEQKFTDTDFLFALQDFVMGAVQVRSDRVVLLYSMMHAHAMRVCVSVVVIE